MKDRTKFIGSSEMGAILGLDPYRTPLKLWALKTGRIPVEDLQEAAEWGQRLEPVVADKFSEKHNVKLMAYKKRFIHPHFDFISCELDRIIVGTDEIVEVKTCNEYLKKNWSGEEMPQNYCVQLNTALGLSKRKKGYVALLAGGQKYIEKHMEFDQELYDMTIQKAVDFWKNYVLADMAPVAVAQDNEDTLDLMYPESKEGVLELCGDTALEMDNLVQDRLGALESKNHLQEELDGIEARIKQIMGEKEAAETSNSKITWKTQSRTTADTEAMKNDGIFEKYKKVSTFRKLNTKKGVSK